MITSYSNSGGVLVGIHEGGGRQRLLRAGIASLSRRIETLYLRRGCRRLTADRGRLAGVRKMSQPSGPPCRCSGPRGAIDCLPERYPLANAISR
jgi:hypothetical protein